MNYTLNQLHIFLKIVQTQSITRASEELHLTQPAVSIQLKNFQDQFEIPLTEVIGRKIHITEFGHEIAAAAENIINQVYAINYRTLTYKGLLAGKLRISVVSTGKYVMPHFLSDFVKLHPEIELNVDVTNKNQVIQTLAKNETDLALVSILPEDLEVEKLELMQNKLYLVTNSEVKIKKGDAAKNIFTQMPVIFREKGSGTRQTMEAFFQDKKTVVPRKMELTSNEAVKQALLAGLGCSIMPLIGLKNEIHNGDLQIIPAKGLPIVTNWSLIWLKGKKHSPVANAFLTFLKEEKENIIHSRFSWYEQYL